MANNPNQQLVTYAASVAEVEQVYYSPVAVIEYIGLPISVAYCFLSNVTGWSGNTVPVPTQDQKSIKNIFKNMFVAKQISPSGISPVIQRIDWTANTVYQYYSDDIDMFEKDANGYLINEYYVRNRYDQVFKCLWNVSNTNTPNGAPSTQEPYFQPGQYNTDNIFYGTDGYKWKYIYTIDTGSKLNFMDSNWIPLPIGTVIPNTLVPAGFGDVEVINVTNGGSGYDPANSVITVTVVGDGAGATASVSSVVGGVIQDIIVTNPGAGYTYANTYITSANGSGAITTTPVSPIGGHGIDPISDLGCSNVMLTCQFNGSETTGGINMVPTDIEYFQMGLLLTPVAASDLETNTGTNGPIYRTTTDIIVAANPDTGFISGETVQQVDKNGNVTFSATVVTFSTSENTAQLINTYGVPTTNQVLKGNTSGSNRTLLSVTYPDFNIGSGYMAYIQNLTGVQRSPDGIEQYKMVLSY
jgi:hypothetical protein